MKIELEFSEKELTYLWTTEMDSFISEIPYANRFEPTDLSIDEIIAVERNRPARKFAMNWFDSFVDAKIFVAFLSAKKYPVTKIAPTYKPQILFDTNTEEWCVWHMRRKTENDFSMTI